MEIIDTPAGPIDVKVVAMNEALIIIASRLGGPAGLFDIEPERGLEDLPVGWADAVREEFAYQFSILRDR